MHKNYYRLLMIFISLFCIYGFASLRRYPPVEKELFSWQIHKNEVETIKNSIISDGYKRVGKDNYPYQGAITTLYEKEITTTKINSKIQILLSFKITDTPNNFYRNLGITISNADRSDIPEINDEVNRIEEILYKKLLEVAGEENVVRGERKQEREKGHMGHNLYGL